MKLIIDRGNHSIKFGFFDKQTIVSVERIENDDKKSVLNIVKKNKIEQTILSSVICEKDDRFIEIILPYSGKLHILSHLTKLPFKNNYETPQTLGKDRVAAVAGAQFLYPNKNILVIDAGTAITYDLLIDNEYVGGNISPGLNMRLKSLHQFTSSLPLVEIKLENEIPGKNTFNAISSGVLNGIVFEIQGYINFFQKKYGKILTIITGGDANYFVEKIKSPIFATPNLVLIGLNRILEYNEEIHN